MYTDMITKKEINESNEQTKEFLNYITKCTGWYKETKNGDYEITPFGKHCSDEDDMIHGNGRPYGT